MLSQRPRSCVVAVDYDPWLLELGRRTASRSIAWIDADLRARWRGALPEKRYDAVVATTAMQWFEDDEVGRIYRDVAALTCTFLTSDLIAAGGANAREVARLATLRRRSRGGEHWSDFWSDARTEAVFADLLEERDRRFAGRPPMPSRPLEFHESALRAAGFADVDEIWRHGENAILLARRGA